MDPMPDSFYTLSVGKVRCDIFFLMIDSSLALFFRILETAITGKRINVRWHSQRVKNHVLDGLRLFEMSGREEGDLSQP